MDIENCIEKIVENGNVEDMHKLSEILEDIMKLLERYDKECFKKYKIEIYKMAYGNTFTREMAEEIVSKMRPYRMRWSLDETVNIQEQYGVDNINPVNFFIVMNSAYNDYKNIFEENIDMYVKFTDDFINDEDAKEGKVFTYFTTIPN